MTRSNAREIACHLVYEMNFNGISADEAMNLLMDPEYYPTLASETEIYAERPSGKQAEYLAGVVHGVEREREALGGVHREKTPSAGASTAFPRSLSRSWRSPCTSVSMQTMSPLPLPSARQWS